MTGALDFRIKNIGPARFQSPLSNFIADEERIRYRVELSSKTEGTEAWTFEKAGPREKIYFDPSKTTAAIVTCGGLSPGINNVIRSVVFMLSRNYGLKRILGYRFGLSAFRKDSPTPITLTPELVRDIHMLGGSMLGSARGPTEPGDIVNKLVSDNVDILFFVGGDGTQRAAHKVADEILRRKLPKCVVGIPKTIDNDVPFVYVSFGFATAVEEACRVVREAGVEARSFQNTISLVKLMGRNAGFIAAHASLAAQEADFVLIPEVPFRLEGDQGLLALVENKVRSQGHAVVVVSEGAGQHLFEGSQEKYDASGNRLQHDIAALLRERLEAHFHSRSLPLVLRSFDPGYSIRAVPANVTDSYYCDLLARAAVHAGMAGKTDMLVGLWYNNLTHVPLEACVSKSKSLDPRQSLWRNVVSVTGQPEII